MGGPTSGPQHDPNSERSRAKNLAGVVGTGVPELRDGISPAVAKEWHNLVLLTSGVTFEQDSGVILELARLIVRNEAYAELLVKEPTNERANKTQLSILRQMGVLWSKLGLDPLDRQKMIRPKPPEDSKPKSRLDQILESNAGRLQ